MMSPAARDITRTLIIKLLLLMLLWFVGFRGAEKIIVDGPRWLLGENQPNAQQQYKQTQTERETRP